MSLHKHKVKRKIKYTSKTLKCCKVYFFGRQSSKQAVNYYNQEAIKEYNKINDLAVQFIKLENFKEAIKHLKVATIIIEKNYKEYYLKD